MKKLLPLLFLLIACTSGSTRPAPLIERLPTITPTPQFARYSLEQAQAAIEATGVVWTVTQLSGEALPPSPGVSGLQFTVPGLDGGGKLLVFQRPDGLALMRDLWSGLNVTLYERDNILLQMHSQLPPDVTQQMTNALSGLP